MLERVLALLVESVAYAEAGDGSGCADGQLSVPAGQQVIMDPDAIALWDVPEAKEGQIAWYGLERPTQIACRAGGTTMPNLVCTGATLQCSFGTTPATFAASGTQTSAGGPAGVVTDTAAANVPPFGMCMSLSNPQVAAASSAGPLVPQPCQPVLSPWSPGSARVTIDDVAALDDSSECICTWGGVVTVSAAGQTTTTLQ